MKQFRFHLLTLSHLPQSRIYSACAFTQKNRKLAKMLTSLGHEVFFYSSEGSDIEEYCNSDKLHFIETHKISDIYDSFGSGDNRFELGYDWQTSGFRTDFDNEGDNVHLATKKFYANCIENINEIKKEDDFLLITQGNYHEPIADAVKLYLNCESGIGYHGSNNKWFRCFESSYLQNYTYGSETPHKVRGGNFFDRVIPNYFDSNDIEFSGKKENYYLFMARLVRTKGILEAHLATQAVGAKLIIAGQFGRITSQGHLISTTLDEFDLSPSNWEYIGFKDIEERKKLMAHATGFFCPSEYMDAFAGTHVEAMLSGTPIITTRFGVFSSDDTFTDGVHGFKCDTLDDFVWAVKNCKKLDSFSIRKHAERFLMDNVKWEFQRWFEDLYIIYLRASRKNDAGWKTVRMDVPEWRKRLYPLLTK
jgi:glycosyltransferase involved in cell wall biosynthesis